MIVRILEEGQYEVPDAELARLEPLDQAMMAALDADDEPRFSEALARAIAEVRAHGRRVDPAEIVPSDLTLPHEGAGVAEVRALLASGEQGSD